MSLFEKIEPETIEQEECVDLPPAARDFKGDDTLTVSYRPFMKLVLLLLPLVGLPLLQIFLEEGLFFLELLCFASLVVYLWIMTDRLLTRDFTFSPDSVVKNGLLGRLVLPVPALLVHLKDQDVTLCHGTDKNIRESIRISRFLITAADVAKIEKYLHDIYRINPNQMRNDSSQAKWGINKLALDEYLKAAGSYRLLALLFVVFPVIAVFTVGLSDSFVGLAPSLPADPIRLSFIALAIAAFYLLRSWARSATRVSLFGVSPIMTRLERADSYAFNSAVLAVSVASLGLLLFLFFGNTLDLYLFLLVGLLYFYDCYPRLSTWEHLAGSEAESKAEAAQSILPRRSLQISLVLMGTLAVMSYGESSHYLYANRKDCQDDWGDGKDCRELPGGSGSSTGWHGGGRYYGPRYGSGGGRPSHAIGVGTISRGGFGSLGGFHASFGG